MKKQIQASSQGWKFEAQLKRRSRIVFTTVLMLVGVTCMVQPSKAQIINRIEANVNHSFIVANTTFPPGRYEFRILPDSDLTIMTVTSADGKHEAEFMVREAQANHTPQHSELIFNRYGDKEFLSKVFEQGSQIGSAVAEVPRQELRLQKKGKHPAEHTEAPAGT